MKRIVICLLAVSMILLLASCGGGKAKNVDLNALTGELTGSGAFTADISGFSLDPNITAMTFGFAAEDLKSCQYYYNNGSSEELLVAEAADADTASRLEELCKNRVELQKSALANYNPDAIPRLDSAVIEKSGSYLVYVVSADSAAVKTVVDKYFK